MSARKRTPSGEDRVPPLEWAMAALGVILLAGLCALLLNQLGTGMDRDVPVLAARIDRVTQTPSGFVADIVVDNRSRQTAAAVQVEGKLGEEQASATVDYVPGRSTARAGLIFRKDPRGGAEISVVGYELP